jgi:anti-sigma B factor antagonist
MPPVNRPPLADELRPRGPVQLEVTEHHEPAQIVLCLEGELDILTAPRFAARLEEVVHREAGELHIDLRHLRFIDSAGLHVLLNAQRRLIRRGRRLRITCVAGTVLRAMELARLVETLGVEVAQA